MTEKPWYKKWWGIVLIIFVFSALSNLASNTPQKEIKPVKAAVEKHSVKDTRTGPPNTLKKYSTVCLTQESLKEISQNAKDKAYVWKMLSDGKCVMLLSDSIVPVQELDSDLPLVKVKMQWGDKTFIGWTDMTNIN